jgi:agmatine/peptidylarginine deiminase
MQNENYILPAEWHRQACVQLTWPHEDTDWLPYLDDITETLLLNMIYQGSIILTTNQCKNK